MPKTDIPDCRECGMCCCHPTKGEGNPDLTEADYKRLSRHVREDASDGVSPIQTGQRGLL